ncbi:MAG: sensor histidine kinase, partial [Anaerolineales bacterium]
AGDWARLIVSDTGIGIPSADLPHIFERFYRVDKARSRAQGGAGLGLSIAQRIAHMHGGRIEASSEGVAGRGSTFSVWLPLLPAGGKRPGDGSKPVEHRPVRAER